MDFDTRYAKLNKNQKAAVDKIDGPLLVIAGPGTGKTELLSMRAAQILRQTDTLPSSILCLTFTDNGAVNMRKRLQQIIGEAAYKVSIHTFHSFGVEIINQYREYFFRGNEFKPADQLAQYQIIRKIFDSLDWNHPLASKNGDDYTYLPDMVSIISELKKSGLTSMELREIIADNQKVMDEVADDVEKIFSNRISKSTIDQFAGLAHKVAKLSQTKLPAGMTSYASVLALSIAHALQDAIESGKTTPITSWKNQWCRKDKLKNTVLKDGLYTDKFTAAIDIYDLYKQALLEAKLYDYDDMILNVIQALQAHPDLEASLKERFQYIMVDEFQDTNLAQLRLLFSLTESESPNVMAVGDDDQAIYSFQGADIGNIQRFREHYSSPSIIVLTDNYRSVPSVLNSARQVIVQGEDRLERTIPDLSKELTPHFSSDQEKVSVYEYLSPDIEKMSIVRKISELISSGAEPESIAVITRKHSQLIDMLPYFSQANILVNYERRDNALEHDIVKLVEKLSRIVVSLSTSNHDTANSLLPELVAHPAFGFTAQDIWKLSLASWRNKTLWLETMQTQTIFQPFANWLLGQSVKSTHLALEEQIDELLGTSSHLENPEETYTSPIHEYFFSADKLKKQPDAYLGALEALRTVRDQLREHSQTDTPTLSNLLEFIDLYNQSNTQLMTIRRRADRQAGHINLMSAHASKGLEFDHVFILEAIDTVWGEKVSSPSRNIPYPANLPLQPPGGSYDERLRLFFVAMTRAKVTLNISYSTTNIKGKPTLVASFLSEQPITIGETPSDLESLTELARVDWHDRLVKPITDDLKTLLHASLESYKLSVTHINNFLDVSHGGPQTFLLKNLLRFPQAKSANASYGTAVHAALQYAHNSLIINGKLPELENILDSFTTSLTDQHLSAEEFSNFHDRGRQALTAFLQNKSKTFSQSQKTELNLAGQGVTIGEARLTGAFDLADIDTENVTIKITDYKTGKPSRSWQGGSDYEKIKLHKYRHQLMFYQLLAENSRDYSKYRFIGGVLQFVEPDQQTSEILALEDLFSEEDLSNFKKLIGVIWQKITSLELPDISNYDPTYKGMLQFENDLLEDS